MKRFLSPIFPFISLLVSSYSAFADGLPEYTQRETWEIKSPELFLTSPYPDDAVEFYVNARRTTQGLRFYPSDAEPDSKYYVMLSGYQVGTGGHTVTSLYEYKGINANLIASVGLYSSKGADNYQPSLSFNDYPDNFDLNFVHATYPEMIRPILSFHSNLKSHFGQVPAELTNQLLADLSLRPIIVQLNEQQFNNVKALLDTDRPTKTVRADFMSNFQQRIAYTTMSSNDLKAFSLLEREAYDFIGDVFKALDWDMPTVIGNPPNWPIFVYQGNPPITGSLTITIKENSNISVNFLKTELAYTPGNTALDIVQMYGDLQGGVTVSGTGDSKKYVYERKVIQIPSAYPAQPPITYQLIEYVGEVNSELLPHGKGVLTTDKGTYLGQFKEGFPDGEIDIYVKGTHVSTKYFSKGIMHGPYRYYQYGVPVSEGWYNNEEKFITREYVYAEQYGMPVGSAKHTIDYTYNDDGRVKSTTYNHLRRVWELEDGRRLYVDEHGNAVALFKNGDTLSGPFEYADYKNYGQNPETAYSGKFYGKCSYYDKAKGTVLEGEYDKELGRFKNGNVHYTFYDDTLRKHVRRRGKYKDGKITMRKTNVFDVLLQGVFQYADDGEIDFFKTSLRSINVVGDWFETALGTSTLNISASDSYSWEDEYYSSQEIRNTLLNEMGYEFTPTPYEDLTYINREYSMKYNGREIIIKMNLPLKGTVVVRNEPSGGGRPEDTRNRDRNNDGTRDPHEAYDYLSTVGQKIIAPVSGVIVHQGYHATGSYLRTIWIDTKAETGENMRVKIFYGELDPKIASDLDTIPINQRMQGAGVPISKGDPIATAQSLDDWYNTNPDAAFVSDHIHFEVHVREDHLRWRQSNKISNPPFLIPPSPVPRIKRNLKTKTPPSL